jgi:large subunit ribosomal protein L22
MAKRGGKKADKADEDERYCAAHYYCPMSPYKIRLVVDLIRGLNANEARETLRYTKKRAALYVDRVLLSAIANAERVGADVQELYVAKVVADGGPMLKRWKAGPHGRTRPILRRRAHIEIVLKPKEPRAR